jgi:hypothetical protein
MTFTVVRAVRGADADVAGPGEKLQRVVNGKAPSIAPANMDLPCADELLHLELSDFARTVPGALEEDDAAT